MKYYRPSFVNVDLDAIHHNYNALSELHPEKTTIAVVKADAYGLGAIQVAQHLSDKGVDFFAVATLDEAIELRMHGIKAKILVLGIIEPRAINKACRHRFAITVPSKMWLEEALTYLKDDSQKPMWLHVKIDTGMNRIGIRDIEEYLEVVHIIRKHPRMVFEGVYTHFAFADIDNEATKKAYERFKKVINKTDKPSFIHAQNTAGTLRFKMNECTAIRVGIGLFGYYPSEFIQSNVPVKLQPAMQLVSEVNFVKKVHKGETVGYSGTFVVEDDTYIATLPIGYADGLMRSMQGFHVNVAGHQCPIVGRICMDQVMVQVPNSVKVGDKVIIIHNQNNTPQSMVEVEHQQQTISYEVLCNLSRRLPRMFYKSKEHTVYNELLK